MGKIKDNVIFLRFFPSLFSLGFRAAWQLMFLSLFTVVYASSVTDALNYHIIIFTALHFPQYFI